MTDTPSNTHTNQAQCTTQPRLGLTVLASQLDELDDPNEDAEDPVKTASPPA